MPASSLDVLIRGDRSADGVSVTAADGHRSATGHGEGSASQRLARVRRAHTTAADPEQAVAELRAGVAQPDMALVLFFCSADYDLDAIASAMRRHFPASEVVGCTTAGEIGPLGCTKRGISGASFPAAHFAVATGRLDDVAHFNSAGAASLAERLVRRIERADRGADASNTFGIALIDGVSMREEPIAHALQAALGERALVGGSAGDGMRFGATHVYEGGAFHTDAAAVALVSTDLPFRPFKTQHFVPTATRVVVTEADPTQRTVQEIDGWPAAEAYARLAGVDIEALDPTRFAAEPMVVVIDDSNYVRSIQRANPDGSLTFYCAIDNGLVLRSARGVDVVENLEHTLAALGTEVGPVEVVVGFDCVLRCLEVSKRGLHDRVEALLREHRVVGFRSYGEQFGGVHVNQTFVGVAIGSGEDA